MRYAFIAENRLIFAVRAMCRMLLVHPSGFYAWLREPFCQRALEDQRQTVLLKQAWDDSGEVYGYRKLHDDLCDLGEDISPNRAWRLARLAGIRAQIGYKKKPGSYGGSPAVVADNTLNREFDVDAPDQFWVTDITYIRTHEGFLYLAVVIDLFSRRVVGWSMQGRTYTDLPLQALLMAVWRRKTSATFWVCGPLALSFCANRLSGGACVGSAMSPALMASCCPNTPMFSGCALTSPATPHRQRLRPRPG